MAAIREGVDGYLLKPAERDELLAAVREALARRQIRLAQPTAAPLVRLLRHDTLFLDLDKHQLECAGRVVDLGPAEFNLLAYLIENAHRTVPPKELVRTIQGYEPDSPREASQIVKWYIHSLRAKIEPDPAHPRHVINLRGIGYTMGPPGRADAPDPDA